MHDNKVLKRLLTVTAIAAMFSAFGVHAQASGASSAGSQGSTGSQGADMSGVQDTTGAGSSAGMTGKTTREGTVGNTDSQGMQKREGKEAGGMSSQGASGTGATAAGASAKSSLSKADETMLKGMAQANIAEVEAGKLALSKSQNDQVKSFAQQMIDDHTKALSDVQQLAQSKGVTLPTEPDAKHKAMATKLESMSGAAFDKAYMAQAGVADHKKVYSTLMADEKRAKDEDVKALATKMAPVVEQHLKSAQKVAAAKPGTKSGN
jgi:predicted outer membrane protein